MSLSYRHKQTVIIFTICILGVGAAGYAAYGGNLQRTTSETSSNRVVVTTSADITPISSTNDWKNQFLSQSTSTKTAYGSVNASPLEPKEPETLSGQFGKKFFEQYMYLKQNNLSEDPTAVKALVDQTTQNLVEGAPLPTQYDVRNVSVATGNDLAAEKAYANMLGSILSAYMPPQDPAILASQALEKNDPTMIREVEVASASYATMLKKMLAVPTPPLFIKNQVNLINGVSSMVFVSEGMSKVFSDPIQGLVALALYEKSLGSLQGALLDLKYIFSMDQLQFSSTDPAIVFTLIN
jgi:hypothetical protein